MKIVSFLYLSAFAYEELKVKHQNPCNHKNFLWDIYVTKY